MKYLKSGFGARGIMGFTIVNTPEYAVRDGFEESFPSQGHLTRFGKKSKKGMDLKWIR